MSKQHVDEIKAVLGDFLKVKRYVKGERFKKYHNFSTSTAKVRRYYLCEKYAVPLHALSTFGVRKHGV